MSEVQVPWDIIRAITSTLLHKLPADIKLIISRSIASGNWNLDALMKKLGEEIEAREHAAAAQVYTPSSAPSKKPRDLPTAHTMILSNACPYCGQGHTPNACTVVTDVESRKEIGEMLQLPSKESLEQGLQISYEMSPLQWATPYQHLSEGLQCRFIDFCSRPPAHQPDIHKWFCSVVSSQFCPQLNLNLNLNVC